MAEARATIDDVREYWNQYVIGIDVTTQRPGSPEFFEEIEAYYHTTYDPPKLLDHARMKGKDLLEVGCGWGCDLIWFAKHGANVTGLDLSASAIELARSYFAYRQLHADLRVGNAENLPFPDVRFDVVVSLGVLHHTPNTEVALEEVYRVLKPGGEALIMLYHRYSWYNLLCRLSGTHFEHDAKDAPIVKLYSKREVLRLLRQFSRVEIEITRLPEKTVKRRGLLAMLYNRILVPVCHLIPERLITPFGFHIVARATKVVILYPTLVYTY
jgi:ubiquinone/menaquinone biosynthesis C-methylase UbiE